MSTKTDFKKVLKHLYNPGKPGFHIVEVPAMNFLKFDGKGNPSTSDVYKNAVEALYALSYGIKFSAKSRGEDYVVPPLEGLWWMEDMNEFTLANKHRWEWTMMIMQPEWISSDQVEVVRKDVFRKKKIPSIMDVRYEIYDEGLTVQILYTGAYVNETQTIAEMHKFIKSNGYQPCGKHHEIYLSDPRKIAADNLQTILRQPIQKQ